MILHGLQQGLDRFAAEIVLAAGGKRIGLIDEQDTAQRRLDDLLRFQRRLPDIAGHQARTVHLDQLSLAQHADGRIQAADQPRHRRLARAGVAEEHHMKAHRRHRQVILLTQLADLDQVHQVLDLFFDGFQADERVQLFHQLVKVRLLGLFLLCLGAVLRACACWVCFSIKLGSPLVT